MLSFCRFKTFEHTFKEMSDIVENWERATGSVRPPSVIEATEGADEPADKAHPASGRKGKKSDKADKKEKKEAKEGKDKEHKEGPGGEGGEHAEEGVPTLTAEEKREKRLEEGIGLPHVVVDARIKDINIFDRVRFPTLRSVDESIAIHVHVRHCDTRNCR